MHQVGGAAIRIRKRAATSDTRRLSSGNQPDAITLSRFLRRRNHYGETAHMGQTRVIRGQRRVRRMPHRAVQVSPSSSQTSPSPVANALAGAVMGSAATASPVTPPRGKLRGVNTCT
jgi:hypothetical protein